MEKSFQQPENVASYSNDSTEMDVQEKDQVVKNISSHVHSNWFTLAREAVLVHQYMVPQEHCFTFEGYVIDYPESRYGISKAEPTLAILCRELSPPGELFLVFSNPDVCADHTLLLSQLIRNSINQSRFQFSACVYWFHPKTTHKLWDAVHHTNINIVSAGSIKILANVK